VVTEVKERLLVLDPTQPPYKVVAEKALRPTTLDGKTIGLLHNSKRNADRLLDELAEILGQRYRFAKIVRKGKPNTRVATKSMLEELARECNVVITGVGD